MNKKNLEILGLPEDATREQVETAYQELRAKYLEERFMDGEVGNNAAKMLTKIDTAYAELSREWEENPEDGGDNYTKVEELIKAGNLSEAQRVLDQFNERGGQWHYLQSVVFYRKNWVNESKKQLEIAIQLEPDNAKYKESYRKINDKIARDAQAAQSRNAQQQQQQAPPDQQPNQSAYNGQNMNSGGGDDSQMGGNCCSNCLECCYTYLCVSCLCNGCCR
ncbi:MAG: J domain-containing protein [Clostridia bacterium]|nr:J domain-containing protein [Clostridia bacterium]